MHREIRECKLFFQSVYPTIVAVPTYPETILDDHGSYTTTGYVELTKRYIDYMAMFDTDAAFWAIPL